MSRKDRQIPIRILGFLSFLLSEIGSQMKSVYKMEFNQYLEHFRNF